MGPSGSGKTSLLNVLAGRTKLCQGSTYSGMISVNGRPCTPKDFGKFGAFVQQEDILIPTMTPRECLTFAIKITAVTRDPYDINKQVCKILRRLKLEDCADVVIGHALLKGISGGEKKRTSIGYELMTNPSLLLMDEPTSGLDSDTAYNLMRLMRREAKERSVAIIATIHTPSSEIFNIFDRIIILSEGLTIYHGPPRDVPDFFTRIGYRLSTFKNPADVLLRLAVEP